MSQSGEGPGGPRPEQQGFGKRFLNWLNPTSGMTAEQKNAAILNVTGGAEHPAGGELPAASDGTRTDVSIANQAFGGTQNFSSDNVEFNGVQAEGNAATSESEMEARAVKQQYDSVLKEQAGLNKFDQVLHSGMAAEQEALNKADETMSKGDNIASKPTKAS